MYSCWALDACVLSIAASREAWPGSIMALVAPLWRFNASAGTSLRTVLDRVALVPEEAHDLLAVIALELDVPLLHGAPRCHVPLEFLCEAADVGVVGEPLHDRDRLPIAARIN